MKKKVTIALVALAALPILVILIVIMSIDHTIKKAVEVFGPQVAGVQVRLADANVSLFGGRARLKGLWIGNPEGFKTPEALQVADASAALNLSSALSDKVIVRSVHVVGPEVTFEGSLKGSNLSKILEHVQAFAAAEKTAGGGAAKGGKRIQIDEFVITEGRVHLSMTLLGGKSLTVPLPTIELRDLGKGQAGLTGAELAEQVLKALLEQVTSVASGALSKAGQGAADAIKGAGQGAAHGLEKAAQGIGGLLKKKP